jgi:pantoate--beta-alanine ligase
MLSVIHQPQVLSATLQDLRQQGAKIGFVPTMGALHDGHVSLVEQSWQNNDITVCSIYVNPTQFNNSDDFLKYPKTIETDTEMLQAAGCDFLFLPSDAEMYAAGSPRLSFRFGALEEVMEGSFRPGHFTGVGIIVSKLFNIVQPDVAYFGLKDLQQYLIVKQLVADLSVPVKIVGCPIIREEDGLAMSSRNKRLSEKQRAVAPLLQQALLWAQSQLTNLSIGEIKNGVAQMLAKEPQFKLEYFEIANGISLESLNKYEANTPTALCIAAFLGDVRLIDNILID